MSIGGGGSYNSGGVTFDTYPGFASGLLKSLAGVGTNAANSFGSGSGSDLTGLAENEVTSTLSGKYLDPSTNPYLEKNIESLTANSEEAFQNMLSKSNANAQGAGALFSTAANKAGQQTAREASSDLASQVNNMLYGNYAAERANQQNAVTQGINLQQLPLEDAMQIAQIMKGMQSSMAGPSGSVNFHGGL